MNKWAYIRGGGLIFGMRRALVHVVGLYMGGLYSEVYGNLDMFNSTCMRLIVCCKLIFLFLKTYSN
jgi:hypothetical protein